MTEKIRTHNIKGVPNDIITDRINGERYIKTEEGCGHISYGHEFIGDLSDFVMITPTPGHKIYIKGITILGDGVSGIVRLKRSSDGKTILPCYFSAHNHASTSSDLNFEILETESILIDTDSRGSVYSFVGVSYLEAKI